MSDGSLVRMLIKTGVSAYLEWLPVNGTFVFQNKQGGGFFSKLLSSNKPMIAKVPANDKEAIKSSLMGWNEKRKCRNFF